MLHAAIRQDIGSWKSRKQGSLGTGDVRWCYGRVDNVVCDTIVWWIKELVGARAMNSIYIYIYIYMASQFGYEHPDDGFLR